jgi:signal transduction histidine kinase
VAASYGSSPAGDLVRLPLHYQGEKVGEMWLAPRTPDESLSTGDRRFLDDLSHQIAVAVHAARLTTSLQNLTVDLQRSREKLVAAREEERRRIRRDLHDGLAPTLAALALTANTVSELIPTDPQAASTLADELQEEIRNTVGDVRRLVYDLRPPTLDQLGLMPAIRERALQYSEGRTTSALPQPVHGPGVQVLVFGPDTLPPLPAAVEVAAYRIVQEALNNVMRHAHAENCVIRVLVDDVLQIEIVDDGAGLPEDHRSGVGLLSMQERASELGGTCVVERLKGGGTRVYARLPLQV